MHSKARELLIPLLKASEGCRLKAYPDPGSGGKPWTIGYGQTGPGIQKGTCWTQEEAEYALELGADDLLAKVAKVSPCLVEHPEKHAAITDLCYNIGLGAYKSSTLKNISMMKNGSTPLWRY